jgi:hypothetical protein
MDAIIQFMQIMCKKLLVSKLNISVRSLLHINVIIIVFIYIKTINYFIIYNRVAVIYYYSSAV